ncbi:uncharacterized protein MKK02DRAFT_45357 [Dioszegia hungarica]|uniref:MARVEL domain-containing protein n=1 Tax=Dioszegia hungarica TaxID=4972 RepID=A0AA38HA55_9TREE|nr:uncharacterized protein MKK02DRAFT_45357 [Dioszegia hungarica]KAI9636652.1 hypothetical protein MKK02DRAFT_45357 [Dioszegia hungarica]
MNKLKSMAATASSKATGMFTSGSGDNLHSVLQKQERKTGAQRRRERSDPFVDGPSFEEPTLPKAHIWIHLVTLFFTFLAVCTIGATAGFQAKWFGVSGGTGFTIFLLLTNFFLTVFLLTVPLIYDRWDRMKRPAQFLQQARATLILHIFGSLMAIIACLIVTVSAFAAPGCKAAADDPHASLGEDFKSGLDQWCTTKKACAVFGWLSFGGWIALSILAVLTFRRERRHEPSFLPPSSPITHTAGIGYTHVANGHDDDNEKAGTDVSYNRPSDAERDVGLYNQPPVSQPVARERYEPRMEPAQAAGMAFPLTPGLTDGPSRTMQLAYSDPYAQVRASLMQSSQQRATPPPQPQQYYAQGGLPAPPNYGGYR